MPLDLKAIRTEIDSILGQTQTLRASSAHDDCSGLDERTVAAMVTEPSGAIGVPSQLSTIQT